MSHDPNGLPPSHIHVEKKKNSWLSWVLLGLGLLILLFALSRCRREPAPARDQAPVAAVLTAPATVVIAPATAPIPPAPAASTGVTTAAALAGTSGLGAYLSGTDAVPRTFQFERVNFDTAKSDIRPADRDEIDTIASTLSAAKTTHVRLTGYADARGSDAANTALGRARAESVKAALVAKGIDASRIDTESGGADDPVASNATASGQAENRRTELTVTRR